MTAGPAETLEANLAHLGLTGCSCDYAWKGLGRLYGISFGKGWVRLNDDPECPHHAMS